MQSAISCNEHQLVIMAWNLGVGNRSSAAGRGQELIGIISALGLNRGIA